MHKYDNESIITKEGLDHIRFRPGMYGIDPFTKQGIYLLVKEILDNSIDESRMDSSNQHVIKICFIRKGTGFQFIVKDCGRGVPINKIVPIFTKPGTSGKWEESYDASGGTHGVGAKATVAMSKLFCAIANRQGEGSAILTVEDCNIINHKVETKNNDKLQSGTLVFCEPDQELMVNVKEFFDVDNAYDDLRKLMEFVSVFVPNTIFEISFSDKIITSQDLKGSPDKVYKLLTTLPVEIITTTSHLLEPPQYLLKCNGINSGILWDSNTIVQSPFKVMVNERSGNNTTVVPKKLGYEVRFFITNDYALRAPCVLGAVNMININDKSSVHITGLEQSIKDAMVSLIPALYVDFFKTAYILPIHLISIVNWQHATFTGQHKHRFTNTDFYNGFIKSLEEQFGKLGNEFWSKLYTIIAEDIVVKYERKNKLDLNIQRSDKNLAFELNNLGCYYECKLSDKSVTELVICEGSSAGDWVKQKRDETTQAVFKLKGKPINALQMTFTEAMRNKIYNDLVKVLGTSPSDTNLDDLRFGKIILLCDADNDGYHITALLVGILHTINPKLLTCGKVIIASPPLYIVRMRNSTMFVRDFKALLDVKSEGYKAVLDIKLVTDNNEANAYTLEGEYFRSFCHMIDHIGRIITNVGNKLNIDACILEQLIHCIDEIDRGDTDGIVKKLGLKSCSHEKASNSLIMDIGDMDFAIPLNGLVQDVKQFILPELKKINWERINFKVTTLLTKLHVNEYLSIIEIFNLFEVINNEFGITRMKGIGELNAEQLKVTCLDPATRSFMTIASPGDVTNIYNLLGVDTKLRKRLVTKNVQE